MRTFPRQPERSAILPANPPGTEARCRSRNICAPHLPNEGFAFELPAAQRGMLRWPFGPLGASLAIHSFDPYPVPAARFSNG